MTKKGAGKIHLLITAGPTREAIDPVRFISNRSTGLMGYELARAAKRSGFEVTLVSGPTALKPPRGVRTVFVNTAIEMKKEVFKRLRGKRALLMASAVSDYRPDRVRPGKIKKSGPLTLRLARNPDILKLASNIKGLVRVGFALESGDLLGNARRKLRSKRLDFIVANRVGRGKTPFGVGKKEAVLIDNKGDATRIGNASKAEMARIILSKLRSFL